MYGATFLSRLRKIELLYQFYTAMSKNLLLLKHLRYRFGPPYQIRKARIKFKISESNFERQPPDTWHPSSASTTIDSGIQISYRLESSRDFIK